MSLTRDKHDEAKSPQARDIKRNCEQVLAIRLEMAEHGWAKLHLALGDAAAIISLSEVFDPFPRLPAWGQKIDEGDLPVEMKINEEGTIVALTALRTGDPQRILLRATRDYENTTLLEGIVSRATLAATLKAELIRFFTVEFDPQHWDFYDDPDIGDDYVQIKDRILNHPWLATADDLNKSNRQATENL